MLVLEEEEPLEEVLEVDDELLDEPEDELEEEVLVLEEEDPDDEDEVEPDDELDELLEEDVVVDVPLTVHVLESSESLTLIIFS